jgi:acetoin utilization protein AcuB
MALDKIMTSPVVSVEMDDTLALVREIFDNTGFHHLTVVEGKKLCGVLSDRDLLKALSPHVGTVSETTRDLATLNKRVHQIMTRKPISLGPNDTVYQAIHIFNQHKISCIPIVDEDDRPVGIISWRDILQSIERNWANAEEKLRAKK